MSERLSQQEGSSIAVARFPITAGDITPEWLTQTLRNAAVLPDAHVVSHIATTTIGEDSGMAGSLARLTLSYDAPELKPQSFVAKFSAADAGLRGVLGGLAGVYEREARFYQRLSGRVQVATPACYFNAYDLATQHSLLLLEDFVDATFGAGDESCTPEEGEVAVAAIARMHAAWWQAPELRLMPWLWRDQEPSSHLVEMTRERYPLFRERFGANVEDALWPLFDRVATGVLPRFSNAETLYHGDFSPKNVCFLPNGSAVVFDWQFVGRGNPSFDLLRFVAAALRDTSQSDRIDTLIRCYQDALWENGITDYPVETIHRDMRAAIALRLARPIGIGGDPGGLDEVRTQTVLRELHDYGVLLADASIQELFREP